jgi:hypothetical protein|nr:MAG TPA: minor tail protein [Caudoviricetes sp.]
MAADGSIIIDTRIDTDGISSGVKEVQAAFKDLANSVKEINANINSIFHDGFEKLEDSFQSLQQKSEKVENSMDKMGNSAKKTGTTVSNSFNKMDISGASRKVNLLGRQFEGLGTIVKRIGFLVGSAFAVGKLIQFGKESIELGSDLAEVQNVVDVTFTTMSDKVNEFAKNAMTSAGLSETMAKRYVGTFGAMSKSFGFSEAQAYDMSTALTQLTGDVASFYNISQDLAYIKLKSVFTGETETLKDLGVVMTQSALDQYALANGYGKTTSAMTEQEKVALRLKFVQDQLSAASGDFIRTSDSWANQVRVMQLQLQSLKATIGQGLINLFSPVLKVINTLLAKLATLANAFKSFTELITGKKSSGATGSASAGIAGANIAETAEGYGTAADNAEDLADATKETAKETKKAQKASKDYLSTLDEIHKATSNDSVSSSPSGSGGSKNGLDNIPKANVGTVDYGKLADGENALDKISESAKKLADLLKKIWKPFQDAWKSEGKNTVDAATYSFSSLGKLAKDVGGSIASVWTNGTGTTILNTMLQIAQNVLITIGNIASRLDDAWKKNEVGTTIIQNIANALQAILTFINNIANDTARWAQNLNFYPLLQSISNLTGTFAPIIKTIGGTLEWLYANIILPVLQWIIETGLPTVINAVSGLLDFLSKHQGIVETFGAVLLGAFAASKIVGLATTIVGAVSKIIGIGKNVITLITGAGGIMSGIKTLVATLGPGGIFAIAISAAIAVGVLLYKNWDKICDAATKLKDWVVEKTRVLVRDASNLLANLRTKISNIWESVKTKTQNIWSSVTTFVSTKVEAIHNAIVDKFTAAKNKVVEVFEGIKTTIRDILNKVIGIANSAIGTVNSAIGGIESAFTFGPWKIPTPFGSRTIGFTANFPRVPTIPYLAKGAVIPPRSEFLAVLGDQKNGRNLETPEDLLRQIVREESGGNQGGGGNYRFTAQLNRRTIFDEMIDEAKLRRDASGTNPFELA